MTTQEAIKLLERLQDAESMRRECEHVMHHQKGGPQLRVRLGDDEIFVRAADFLPLVEYARERIVRELREGGYTVPDGGR